MSTVKLSLFSICLFCVSQISYAQVEKITPGLINQYGLNFSIEEQSEPYTLAIGTQLLINQGYDVSIGALYLKDNKADTLELISKTLQGQPAEISWTPPYAQTSLVERVHSTDDFGLIIYVSDNPNIVAGDSGSSTDLFIYNRLTDKTSRVEGNHPQQGSQHPNQSVISQLRISPNGEHVVFTSFDKEFSDDAVNDSHYNVIYVYDLSTLKLSALPFVNTGSNEIVFGLHNTYVDEAPNSFPADSFSPDGQHLFFNFSFIFDDFAATNLHVYNFDTGETKLIDNTSEAQAGWIKALNDTVFVYSVGFFNPGGDLEFLETLRLYDLQQNQTYPLQGDGVFGSLAYSVNRLSAQSANNRYALFYSSYRFQENDLLNLESGRLWVLDIETKELRKAFVIDKTGNLLNIPGSYIVQPTGVRFHNSGRYISFEGNSWYIDDSIAFNDVSYDDNNFPIFVRDTFVVVNPFLTDINLVGEPSIDRSSETGLYVWRHTDGRSFVQAVAGDSAQGNLSTQFSGLVASATGITGLTPYSIEANDELNQPSSKNIAFRLNVISPWEDRFVFNTDNNGSLCVELSDYAGGLFIGPGKVQVTPSYDIGLLKGCDAYQIPVDGNPNVERFDKAGWYIWRENGQWRSELRSQYEPLILQGTVIPSEFIGYADVISVESNDKVIQSGKDISFTVNTAKGWYDGVRFPDFPNAEICVSLSESTNANIFIGPDRVPMPKSFDLNTLQSCDAIPDVETLGRPSINRSVDHGIFAWENAAGQWQVEVVSADMARWVDVDVSSALALSNVQPVNLETNDTFNVSASMIDARLRVFAPWMDGFRFTVTNQSNGCLSTITSNMPIYIGPNRVYKSSSVNLDTLQRCQ